MFDQLFPLVMEHDPNLIFVKDENSVILYANRAFLEVYPPERRGGILGTTTVEDFAPSEAELWLSEDRRALELGRTEMVEEIVDYAGRRRVLLTRKIAFKCVTGAPRLLGISTDITELADRERRLVETCNRLERFTAFAAHDLRSPLASMASALELIVHDRETTLGPRSARYVELMGDSARGLAQHVTSMLQAAKAEHAEDVEKRETDLAVVLEEVRFNLSALLEQEGATLHASRMPRLAVEPDMFRQLLQNLIENAVRHRSERPPVVIVRHEETDTHHLVSVEDNGVGIASEDRQRVFEAFQQGAAAAGGTGVGLALCHRIAELHDAAIGIDGDYVGGCRIVIGLAKAAPGDRIALAA